MNHMKFLIVFILFASTCFGQSVSENKNSEESTTCWDGHCAIAIAIEGLRIRDTMSSSGYVIGTIPFGEKVDVLAPTAAFTETIDSLDGYWVKIKYKELQGYVFSCFLAGGITKMDQPYYLLIPYGGCGENMFFSLKYNYYGYYESNINDKMESVKISPIFYSLENLITIKADSTAQPVFIIASKETMTSGPRECSYSETNLFSNGVYGCFTKGKKTTGLTNGKYYLDVENFNNPDQPEKKLVMVNQQTKKKQLIATSQYTLQLIWDGDLDGDGKTDLIIFKGGEKGGDYELFLSSKAKQGNFVKKVATFEAGDCC